MNQQDRFVPVNPADPFLAEIARSPFMAFWGSLEAELQTEDYGLTYGQAKALWQDTVQAAKSIANKYEQDRLAAIAPRKRASR